MHYKIYWSLDYDGYKLNIIKQQLITEQSYDCGYLFLRLFTNAICIINNKFGMAENQREKFFLNYKLCKISIVLVKMMGVLQFFL